MPKIALVTDSTCDMPEAQQSRHRPVVVPLHFAIGGVSYLDRVDMDSATFYKRFRENGQVAHSSQPSVGEFVSTYSALLAHNDAVVSVHISGRLSGTVQSASVPSRERIESRPPPAMITSRPLVPMIWLLPLLPTIVGALPKHR